MTNHLHRAALLTIAATIAVASLLLGQAGTNALKNPAGFKEMAPAMYKVNMDTSAGPFVIEVHRDWSPNGADRFYNLVKSGFLNDVRFYRVVKDFMVQFGLHGDPAVSAAWSSATIPDDKVKESNKRGYVTFAKSSLPNSRSTQLFINFGDNANLDPLGFSPIGRVSSGMDVVDKLYSGYGDMAEQRGNGPSQAQLQTQGNAYLTKSFPKLDYIKKATIAP
jgi:peptidyl-prolyl cis-trans isomerase A (cyclophilin A)